MVPVPRVDSSQKVGHLSPMSITLAVEKDTIKLPSGIHLPDGTKVQVTLPDEAADEAAGKKDGKWMLEFAGIADDMPRDLARNLDHYVHGQSRKP